MTRWSVAMALVGLMVVAGRVRADDKQDVTRGAQAWVNALLDGDVAAVKAHSIGDEKELTKWEAVTKMLGAMKRLNEAAVAKFGDQGAMLGAGARRPDFAQIQKDSQIQVAGDEATLINKDRRPLKLKKDGKEWKVVLGSIQDNSRADAAQMAAITGALSGVADEIKDGKYPTAREALMALGQKIKAAGTGGGGGPGKPDDPK